MLPPAYHSGPALEAFLEAVFLRAADPGPVRRRVALRFDLEEPRACLHVDGRGGVQAVIRTGEAARELGAELVFRLTGETAHRFWSGRLEPLPAVASGQLALEGNVFLALALAPGLRQIQAAYIRALEEQAEGESGPG